MGASAEERTDPMLQAPPKAGGFKGFAERARAQAGALGAQLKARAADLARKVKENFPKDIEDLKKIKPDELLERFQQLTGGRSSGLYLRMAAALVAAYFLADTLSLLLGSLVPDPPTVPPPIVHHTTDSHRSVMEYAAVLDRDIFSSAHIIPTTNDTSVARKTTLPLNLIGTIVLKNELKSIATIEDRSQNMTYPVRIGDVVNNQIEIKTIQHFRVEFINMSTGNKEYVEIVDDAPTMNIRATHAAAPAPSADGITAVDETHRKVDAHVIRDNMEHLNDLLQQARAIPNFENGMPNGYKILQITPGSLFEKFGIQNNDVLTGLNGEALTDPGKALSMLNDLPNARHVEITVVRNGRKMNMNYDIQ